MGIISGYLLEPCCIATVQTAINPFILGTNAEFNLQRQRLRLPCREPAASLLAGNGPSIWDTLCSILCNTAAEMALIGRDGASQADKDETIVAVIRVASIQIALGSMRVR